MAERLREAVLTSYLDTLDTGALAGFPDREEAERCAGAAEKILPQRPKVRERQGAGSGFYVFLERVGEMTEPQLTAARNFAMAWVLCLGARPRPRTPQEELLATFDRIGLVHVARKSAQGSTYVFMCNERTKAEFEGDILEKLLIRHRFVEFDERGALASY